MTDTSSLWFSLNNNIGEEQAPVVEVANTKTKEPNPAFRGDLEALSRRFPQLESALNGKTETLILEIDLKEIFRICPRSRQRIDRYSKLQEYLKETFGVTLIINSQKTKWL